MDESQNNFYESKKSEKKEHRLYNSTYVNVQNTNKSMVRKGSSVIALGKGEVGEGFAGGITKNTQQQSKHTLRDNLCIEGKLECPTLKINRWVYNKKNPARHHLIKNTWNETEKHVLLFFHLPRVSETHVFYFLI